MNDELQLAWCPMGTFAPRYSTGRPHNRAMTTISIVNRPVPCGFSVSGQVLTLLPLVGGGLAPMLGGF